MPQASKDALPEYFAAIAGPINIPVPIIDPIEIASKGQKPSVRLSSDIIYLFFVNYPQKDLNLFAIENILILIINPACGGGSFLTPPDNFAFSVNCPYSVDWNKNLPTLMVESNYVLFDVFHVLSLKLNIVLS